MVNLVELRQAFQRRHPKCDFNIHVDREQLLSPNEVMVTEAVGRLVINLDENRSSHGIMVNVLIHPNDVQKVKDPDSALWVKILTPLVQGNVP